MNSNDVNLDHVRAFVTLAKVHDYSEAAKKLGIEQPALTARVQALERKTEFELKATRRQGAQFDVTTAGEELLQAGIRLVEAADIFARKASQLATRHKKRQSEVRVAGGATASDYILPRCLGEFGKRHQAIHVKVRGHKSKGIIALLREGVYDFGIVTKQLAFRRAGKKTLVDIEQKPWIKDHYQLICGMEHTLADRNGFRWSDLDGEDFATLGEAGVMDIISKAARENNYRRGLSVKLELPTIRAILEAVRSGTGLGFVTTSVFGNPADKPCTRNGIRFLPCLDGPIERELVLVRLKACRRDGPADTLWRFLCENEPIEAFKTDTGETK